LETLMGIPTGHFDIFAVSLKAYGHERLTAAELDFASALALSSDREAAITGNAILLLAGTPTQQQAALAHLRLVSRDAKLHENPRAEAALVTILEFFPEQELCGTVSCAEFVYRVAKSPFLPSRVNAMRVLRQMATAGDQQAVALLREATKDRNPFVKRGAEDALRLVGDANRMRPSGCG
jgi:hypothetical protein